MALAALAAPGAREEPRVMVVTEGLELVALVTLV